jgi:hypothetical protein
MLNTLANHGYLPHTGRKITKDTLLAAIVGFVQLDSRLASNLADQALKLGYDDSGIQLFDLENLSKHNEIEHDASLTRLDFDLGNNTLFNPAIYARIYDYAELDPRTEKWHLSLSGLAQFRKYRQEMSQFLHPDTYVFNTKFLVGASAEASILFLLFRDDTNRINMDWLDVFFKEERFPFELGWKMNRISGFELMKTLAMMIWQSRDNNGVKKAWWQLW